jgi:hypothetical protein
MEQMASRPFAGVVIQLNREQTLPNSKENSFHKCNNNPTPIALEPCSTGKAAVLSLIVRMPSGGLLSSPAGMTCILISKI